MSVRGFILFLLGTLSLGISIVGCTDRGAIQIESISNFNSIRAELKTTVNAENNLSLLPVTLEFSQDVQDLTDSKIQVVNGVISNFTGSGSNYSFDVTPSADGPITVTFPESDLQVSSKSTKRSNSTTLSFTVDRVKPTVIVATSVTDPTTTASIPIEITFSEDVTGLIATDFVVTGGGAAVTAFSGSGQNYVLTILATLSGAIQVQLPIGAAQDLSGNATFASNTLTVNYDGNVPTPVLSSTAASTNNLSSIPVVISFGAVAVTGLTASDFTVVNGTATSLTGSGASYSLDLVPSADGLVTIVLPQGVVQNSMASLNVASNTLSFTVDRVAPTGHLGGPSPATGNSNTVFSWNINYVDATNITLAASDITLGGSGTTGCVVSVTGSGVATRTVSVTGCSGNGTLNISVAAGTAADLAGNTALAFGASANVTVNSSAFTLALSSAVSTVTNLGNIPVTVTASSSTANFNSGSLNLINATVQNFTGSGAGPYTFDLIPGVDGSVSVNVLAGVVDGNVLSNLLSFTVDRVKPLLNVSSPSPSEGKSTTSFTWTVTYSGADTITLTAADVTLNGAPAGCGKTVSGTGNTRTVSVTGCTAAGGSVSLSIAANTAQDSAGNQALAASGSAVTVDNTAPLLAITSPVSGAEATPIASFAVSGTCNEEGKTVSFTPAATSTVVCSSAAWSAQFDFSTLTATTITITASISDSAGNLGSASINYMIPQYRITKVFSNKRAFAAVRANGSVVAWGESSSGGSVPTAVGNNVGSQVRKIVGSFTAFAALKADGSVTSWGDTSAGGALAPTSVRNPDSGVIDIFSTATAFAALKVDGSVVAWGNSSTGGEASEEVKPLNAGVVKIFSNDYAFVALKSDGVLSAWGHATYGGDITSLGAVQHVVDIANTTKAFAAVKSDGSVITWGEPSMGGDTAAIASSLSSGVVKVFGNEGGAFAALKSDGTVVAWGNSANGGSAPSAVTAVGSKVVKIFSTPLAFTALKSNGSIVAWGNASFGGSTSSVTPFISGSIKNIFSNSLGFAALKYDGSVVQWGTNTSAPLSVVDSNSNVATISGTLDAFAALKSDGTVVSWGNNLSGGNGAAPASVTALNSNVIQLFSNDKAFTALKSDGSVLSWGDPAYGGGVAFSGNKSGTKEVASTNSAFAALSAEGVLKAWGLGSSGGTLNTAVTSSNTNFKKVFGNAGGAFTGLKADGSIVVWGNTTYGGQSAPTALTSANAGVVKVISGDYGFAAITGLGEVYSWGYGGIVGPLSNMKEVFATSNGISMAFAALRHDGSVQAWGSGYAASAPTSVTNPYSDVVHIASNAHAFAALKADGSVVAWGDVGYGDNAPASVTNANSGVTKIFSTSEAFVALKTDGSLVAWGSSVSGGSLSLAVTSSNNHFSSVVSNGFAFAAKKSSGEVFAWGNSTNGGYDPGLTNVIKIWSNASAFAALKASNNMMAAWGVSAYGGQVGGVYGVYHAVGNDGAFAGLRADGRVESWGDSSYGSTTVPNALKVVNADVIEICRTTRAFVALRADGSISAWGDSAHGGTTPAP